MVEYLEYLTLFGNNQGLLQDEIIEFVEYSLLR